MHTTIQMSYGGFAFRVNPATLNTSFSKKIETRVIPFGFGKAAEVCRMPVRITGTGMLTGSDAGERAHDMMRVFERGGSSYLFIPQMAPMKAFFTDLTMHINAEEQGIEFTFAFTEDCTEKKSRYPFGYTVARRGENLYDIANRCNVNSHDLFEVNDFMDMFSVEEGDRVWLK